MAKKKKVVSEEMVEEVLSAVTENIETEKVELVEDTDVTNDLDTVEENIQVENVAVEEETNNIEETKTPTEVLNDVEKEMNDIKFEQVKKQNTFKKVENKKPIRKKLPLNFTFYWNGQSVD